MPLRYSYTNLLLVVQFYDKCTHEKKTLSVLSSWANALKVRHQDKQTAKTALKKKFKKQKYQLGADQFAIYEVKPRS